MRKCSWLYSSAVRILLGLPFLLIAVRSSAAGSGGVTLDLNGQAVQGAYTVELQVGTPPQTFNVVVDTGSSNLILLGDSSICDNCSEEFGQSLYDPSKSGSAQLSATGFTIRYGSGSLQALEVRDKVTLGGLPTIDYTFGVMTHQAGIQNILGMAYPSVAQPQDNPLTPFFDELVSQAGVANTFSMLLCGDEEGKITFGTTDAQMSQYVDITDEKWYVISPNRLQVQGGKKLGRFSVPTVVDSGTTDLEVPSSMYEGIMRVLNPIAKKNGVDLTQGLIRTSAEVIGQFPVLQILAENTEGQEITLDISPSTYFKKVSTVGYLFRIRVRNEQIILGQVFMKNYHVVFDRANKRIGFGPNDACNTSPGS